MGIVEHQYGEAHIALLWALIHRGVLKMAEVRAFLKEYPGVDNADELNLNEMISEINKKVKGVHSLKTVKNEHTGLTEVVLMWVPNGPALKEHATFQSHELDYFRLVMENIAISEHKCIKSMDALNLVSQMVKPLSKSQAQQLLEKFRAMRYLEIDTSGRVFLDSRAIHEFEPYFVDNMKSVLDFCNICKNVVFQSVVCAHCAESVHRHCLLKFTEKIKKWPCCKNVFEEDKSNLPMVCDYKFPDDSTLMSQLDGSQVTRKRKTLTQD